MIRSIQSNSRNIFVLGILVGFATASLFHSYNLHVSSIAEWASGFWQNFSTEMIGAAITFLLFELIIESRRRKEENIRRDEERLLDKENRRAAQQINAIGRIRQAQTVEQKQAIIIEMKSLSLLNGADLQTIDLSGIDLSQSDLEGAKLDNSDLSLANLQSANLRNASLRHVDLTKANLISTSMQGADLSDAILKDAWLSKADQPGGMELLANFEINNYDLNRFLEYTQFDVSTILPDGSIWTSGTDIRSYTTSNNDGQNV